MSAAICLAFFVVGTGLLTYGIRGWRQVRREEHYLPAAPDNKAGVNADDLWACRHIHNTPARTEKKR